LISATIGLVTDPVWSWSSVTVSVTLNTPVVSNRSDGFCPSAWLLKAPG